MSYPIVLIFGIHDDPSCDYLAKNVIPKLAKEGYNRYCVELPSTWSIEAFLTKTSQMIESIIMNRDFSRGSSITSLIARKEAIELADKHFYCTLFIDDETATNNLTRNTSREVFLKSLPTRDTVMCDHLFRLYSENKGVISVQGPGHYQGFIERLKKKGVPEQDIICHFPRNTDYPMMVLSDHERKNINKFVSYTLTKDAINRLGDKILNEVKSKSRPVIELKDSTHSQFLTNLFKVNFKTILRPEYYADAVLPAEQVTDTITESLNAIGIKHYTDNDYLIIPNVNTKEVAHDIRLIKT